ncbi:MAG: exodeoxyribonuclease VII large subunit [Flavisolibacter sp.]|nr:exodeoxyribonuclease VII large subunit [Flavisolibacter sp.]
MEKTRIFSLLEVTRSIRKTIADRYTSSFWVKAEMNKLNHYHHSGHCYPELVEKDNGKVIAQINGILWKTDFVNANNKFIATLKEPLKDGIKILFLAKITFDPAHGMALQIVDIDPAYTMGDLEKEKQDTIAKLHAEGIYNKNKSLKFPQLPQRIAIISVETSKGYADFLSVISNNQWGYHFLHHLFPSLLQGEKAVDGIIKQLNLIRKVQQHFDVVAIIRGGGGDVGLTCYNSYILAKEIANFPLPVITGIGHATNVTVAEMISHLNAITPTKLADYLMQRFHEFAVPVQNAERIIIERSGRILEENHAKLRTEVKYFRSATEKIISFSNNRIRSLSDSLHRQSLFRFRDEKEMLASSRVQIAKSSTAKFLSEETEIQKVNSVLSKDIRTLLLHHNFHIDNFEKNVTNMSPENVLKRGYSITLFKGHSIKCAADVEPGDTIETVVYDGSIISTTNSTTIKK